MFGSVDYFTNSLKAGIMNNFGLSSSCSIQDQYTQLKTKIMKTAERQFEREAYLQNLEKAYLNVKIEIFGLEDSVGEKRK
ncbi:hypothetical protein [Bacillus norwichensis]|uniref:Uncharacterized protein n=1 Tax=Bacillus norwichensis TaxID=2762217 RepID=A0ABR8VK26_9BACI|nr:hypothetical protein [Bacillus norwichensis]MBD8005105.1 hypothetical protein [Bacillus norwichensis]